MYQVMVVDDEMLIRKGITSFINASGGDFQVAESFADGDQAIGYLKEHDVDLIISDIRMTRVSGIELAQYVAENKPYIRVILLSGYKEFEYARSAIQYGVKNYLLKPTDFAQFREVLSSMKKELDESADRRETVLFMDRIKALYAWILSGRKNDAREAMMVIFKDAQSCPLSRMRQYIYDVFEILLDKFNLYLRIKVDGEKLHLEQLIMQESEENLRECALEILDRVYGLVQVEEVSSNDFVLQEIRDYIQEHLHEDISLQDAADKMFFSTVYFSRYFKKQMGETFSSYLLRMRMERAVRLLKENRKVAEISEACGYHDPSYFARIFKEYYKYTPTDYARRFM